MRVTDVQITQNIAGEDQAEPGSGSHNQRESGHSWLPGLLLALLPFVSFVSQYLLSKRAGTLAILHHHLSVMIVDWVFVPFNYFVVRAIRWSLGGRMFVIWCFVIVFNLLTVAIWQVTGADFGHMISAGGVVLPAGWVHLGFATIETFLLTAFVFCRDRSSTQIGITSALATAYFITMITCGYWMHHGFILSDVVAAGSGLFFVLVYPRIISGGHPPAGRSRHFVVK
jgi:hypothetical protein